MDWIYDSNKGSYCYWDGGAWHYQTGEVVPDYYSGPCVVFSLSSVDTELMLIGTLSTTMLWSGAGTLIIRIRWGDEVECRTLR